MPNENATSKRFAGWMLAFILSVFGAHCWVVWLYGSALPFWDQWDEALYFLKPWVDGHLAWTDFVSPASDHRIIVTHLWDMFLISLNGRWEPLLQMVANGVLHTIYAGGLAFCIWHFLGRKNAWLVCGLLLPFFILPFAGENAIWGLNSLWYFIYIFGLGAIVGLGFSRFGSWQWWVGLLAALLGLMTMATGPLAPLAVAGLILLRAIKNRQWNHSIVIPLSICLLFGALGVAGGAHNGDNTLKAHSFAEFIGALIRYLDWPFFKLPWMALVIPLPLAGLLYYYFRPGFQATREAEFLLTLALWSVLQTVVLSFGRANYGDVPASRYTEIFSLLLISSIFSFILLCDQWRRDRILNFNALLMPLVYAGVIFWGLCQMSEIVVDNLIEPTRFMNVVAEERVTVFLATSNDNDLLEAPTIRPAPKTALTVLRDSKLQSILPLCCISPAAKPTESWLTPAALGLLRYSTAIMTAGLTLFVSLCAFGLFRSAWDMSYKKPENILILLAALLMLGFVLSKHSMQRGLVEYGIQQQLADYFKSEGKEARAAYHAHKAEELKIAQ